MIIVELPDKEKGWMQWETDGHYMGTIWCDGENVQVEMCESGRWRVTLRDNGSILGFIYADAIRRK